MDALFFLLGQLQLRGWHVFSPEFELGDLSS